MFSTKHNVDQMDQKAIGIYNNQKKSTNLVVGKLMNKAKQKSAHLRHKLPRYHTLVYVHITSLSLQP